MRPLFRRRLRLTIATAVAVLMLVPAAALSAAGKDEGAKTVADIEFIGEVIVPTGTPFGGTEIGGLSSITFDESRQVYYTVSDDQGNRPTGDPVRYYTVEIDFADGYLDAGDVVFTDVTTVFEKNKTEFAPGGLDPEGFVLTRSGQLYMSSEGNTDPLLNPFINRYNLNGRLTAQLPIPDKYLPNGIDWGVRRNLSFESLNLTPDEHFLVTAGEGALFQDGPAASFTNGSLARVLTYDIHKRLPVSEYVYEVEPWAEPSSIFGVNGIVEVLPIDNHGTMLVMERSFSVFGTLGHGTANYVVLYEASSMGATDVLDNEALYVGGSPIAFTPMTKHSIFEFDDIGVPIDNIEGMTFGPVLPDGRQSLVIVSDNNFGAGQFTQFIVLALDIEPAG
ncbi:MAG: esterase-like activity of phytase family protein [Actinomycetota bacterium]